MSAAAKRWRKSERFARALAPCIVAFAVGAFGVSGAVGATVPAKTVPPKDYVKQLCRGLKDVQSALNVFISTDDLSAYQAQALENDAAIITKAEDAQTRLSQLIPTSGKRKVTRYWNSYFDYAISSVGDARDAFAAVGQPQTTDPASQHYQAVLEVENALADIISASYTRSKVVFAAFGNNATCKEVTRVAEE